MNKEYFAINHVTHKAVIIEATDYREANATARTIIGPETQAHQIGVCPRPRPAFDRFPDAQCGIIFDVPSIR
jgi:hypothetical protein